MTSPTKKMKKSIKNTITKSKKFNENVINGFIKKEADFLKKLDTSVKDKTSLKKCNDFCKKNTAKKVKLIKQVDTLTYAPLNKVSKEYKHLFYTGCKKLHCNKNCDGFTFFGNKDLEKNFLKDIKDGFKKNYSAKRIKKLKKEGVLSGCGM